MITVICFFFSSSIVQYLLHISMAGTYPVRFCSKYINFTLNWVDKACSKAIKLIESIQNFLRHQQLILHKLENACQALLYPDIIGKEHLRCRKPASGCSIGYLCDFHFSLERHLWREYHVTQQAFDRYYDLNINPFTEELLLHRRYQHWFAVDSDAKHRAWEDNLQQCELDFKRMRLYHRNEQYFAETWKRVGHLVNLQLSDLYHIYKCLQSCYWMMDGRSRYWDFNNVQIHPWKDDNLIYLKNTLTLATEKEYVVYTIDALISHQFM